MKLELKKAQLANLTNDSQVLPQQLTPQVAGGANTAYCGQTHWCPTRPTIGGHTGTGLNTIDECLMSEATCILK